MSDKSAIIKEAQKYLARGQIDKAIAEWEKIIKDYPDGNTYNTIGDLYIKKGEQTSALDSYQKAASFFRQEGFSLKALALYKKILNINPSDAISLIALGELNEGKGLVTDAIKFYLAASDTLSKEGQKEKLLEIYEKILALSPGNLPLRTKITEIYIKEGLTSEAAKQYLHIAGLYAEKGETEKSIDYYKKALDIEPVNKDAILGLNHLYEKTGRIEQALEQLKESINLFPQDADILLRCAEININLQKFQEAQDYLKSVIEIEPSNTKARRLFGDTYIEEGDKEKAWAEYLPIIDEMLLEEKYDDAVKLLESFKEIDPIETGKRLVSLYIQLGEYPHIVRELTALGDVYLENEKQKEALNCYKEALKMSPDDETIKTKVSELERKVRETITIEAEKPTDEALLEADIFLRYGLYENARDLLETYKVKEPENIDIHNRLKSLYVDIGDKELAVTECLILEKLYKKAGDIAMSDQVVREAFEINQDDPRLVDREIPALHGEETAAVEQEKITSVEDFSEELAEADFYAKQGLIDEAREILDRLHNLLPEDQEISQKLASLGQTVEFEDVGEETKLMKEEPLVPESEILEAEEISEPALDSDVMEIFNEFKKGLEKELEEEDYETHYNLGIAYKEMGFIDDAIREFQSSRNDPKKFISSSNMLGICYMEKGLYSLAVDVLKSAVEKMQDKNESYWAMKYDLAKAYEKNNNLKEALDICTEVYGWNSKFRAVSDKINHLRAILAEGAEQKKPKDRKDRVSYI